MPIQFRCTHCKQKLSVTRKKAGQEVACPACAKPLRVPTLDEASSIVAAKSASAAEPADSAASRATDDSGNRPAVQSVTAAPVEREPLPSEFPPPAPHKPEEIAADVTDLWREQSKEVDPWLVDETETPEEEFSLGRRGMAETQMDMTPMVDVTFLLLIFFMITAAFDLQKSMQTTPPEPEDEGAAQTVTIQEIEESSVEVEIDAEDRILVDGEPVASIGVLIDVLTRKIAEERLNEMLIRADYRATHGTVVSVTDAGMEANMQHIRQVIEGGDE